MKRNSSRRDRAFTLIEMIGVLAVIAILASLLVPKIYEAINSARISQAVLSVQTIKTAVMEHYAKFYSLASSNGVPLAFNNDYPGFDRVLLGEGLIDQPFKLRIDPSAFLLLRAVPTSTVVDAGSATAYDLDGDGNSDLGTAHFILEVFFANLPHADAMALNDRLDGAQLGEGLTGTDLKGRVIYDLTKYPQVHIYITHF